MPVNLARIEQLEKELEEARKELLREDGERYRILMRMVMKDKPFVLGKRGEDVLKAVHFYRYMTAVDVAYLLFAPSSLVRVRQLLASLCGGVDFGKNQYLYRVRMPDVSAGNPQRVYTLGARGREFVKRELGLSVDKSFRPDEGRQLSFTQVRHNLALTRFLVAAHRWATEREDFALSKARICYDLAAGAGEIGEEGSGRRKQAPVIPDGWLLFEKVRRGGEPKRFPVLLEIDRGTMYRERIKRHVSSRIEFVTGGGYKRIFGTEAVVIAYVAVEERGEEGRRRALASWTAELLKEQGRESWASAFRFCSAPFDGIYESGLFEEAVWYRPDRDAPVGLFEG